VIARTHRWLRRHRAAVGYVFLVAATALVLEWHHTVTTGEIADLQRRTCTRATVLADNQRRVLETLIAIVSMEQLDGEQVQGHVREQLQELRDRLDSVPEFDCE